MKTNTSYIHEYDILDDINECVNITIDSANSAYYSYEAALRHADLSGFFENDGFLLVALGIFTIAFAIKWVYTTDSQKD